MMANGSGSRPPLPVDGQFATHRMADGVEIRSALWHPAAARGRPVLFLAGKRDFLERYREAYARLLEAGHPVATFDWRDQGLSTRCGGARLFAGMRDDLIRMGAWAAETFGRGYALVAHSMGGHLALRALAAPTPFARSVERAVLLAPMLGIGGRGVPSALMRLLARVQVQRGRGAAFPPGQGPYGPEWRSEAHRLRLTGDRARFERACGWCDDNEALAAGGATWHWLDSAFASIRAVNAAGTLARIETETLLLVGTNEVVVDARAIARAARLMPNARLVRIPDGRHELLQESDAIQALVWPHLLDFLGVPG